MTAVAVGGPVRRHPRRVAPDRVRGRVVGELDRRPRRSDGHAGRPAGAERRRRCGCAGDAMAHGSTTRRVGLVPPQLRPRTTMVALLGELQS
jgi:hypothetical protein